MIFYLSHLVKKIFILFFDHSLRVVYGPFQLYLVRSVSDYFNKLKFVLFMGHL